MSLCLKDLQSNTLYSLLTGISLKLIYSVPDKKHSRRRNSFIFPNIYYTSPSQQIIPINSYQSITVHSILSRYVTMSQLSHPYYSQILGTNGEIAGNVFPAPLSTPHGTDIKSAPLLAPHLHSTPNSSLGRRHRFSSTLAAPGATLRESALSAPLTSLSDVVGGFWEAGRRGREFKRESFTFAFITMCRADFEVSTVIVDLKNMRSLFETCACLRFLLENAWWRFFGRERSKLL